MIRIILKKVSSLFLKLRITLMGRQRYIKYLRGLGVRIGENCDIEKSADFGSEPYLVKLGNSTRITRGVKFITHDGGLWTLRKMGLIESTMVKYGPIVVGDNCNISWDVIIMPNVTIGDNCIVAAGAVVTKDIPSNSIWGGVPAKRIESVEEYYEKVKGSCIPTFSMTGTEKEEYIRKKYPSWF